LREFSIDALASRLSASSIKATVTKVATASARFSKSSARRGQLDKCRRTNLGAPGAPEARRGAAKAILPLIRAEAIENI
jgi:hypothetical protein